MAGNKHDNGVLEQGTDEIRISYQEDTPGQSVDDYIKEKEQAFHETKETVKKRFKDVFGNPLKDYPYNEEFVVIDEAVKLPNITSSGMFSVLDIDASKLKPKQKEQIMQVALDFNKGARRNMHGQVEVNSGRVNPAMVRKASKLNQLRFSGKHNDLELLMLDIKGGVK